jgi:hypothetical protein
MAKKNHEKEKSEEISCFEVQDFLFWGLEASPVACTIYLIYLKT